MKGSAGEQWTPHCLEFEGIGREGEKKEYNVIIILHGFRCRSVSAYYAPQQTSSIELFFSLSSLYSFKKKQRTTRKIHVNLIQDSISIKFCWTCWHCDLVTDRALLFNDRSQKLRVFPPPKINGNLLLFVSGSTNLLPPQILEGPPSPGKRPWKRGRPLTIKFVINIEPSLHSYTHSLLPQKIFTFRLNILHF